MVNKDWPCLLNCKSTIGLVFWIVNSQLASSFKLQIYDWPCLLNGKQGFTSSTTATDSTGGAPPFPPHLLFDHFIFLRTSAWQLFYYYLIIPHLSVGNSKQQGQQEHLILSFIGLVSDFPSHPSYRISKLCEHVLSIRQHTNTRDMAVYM